MAEFENDYISNSEDSDSVAVEHAMRRLKRYDRESRFLTKRSEDYKVMEEVFDLPTLTTLHNLMNTRIFHYLNGVVSAGKEARVYWGVREDGSNVAVKIYLTTSVEFRRRLPYITGDPRFSRIKKDTKSLVYLWAKKEYKNLKITYSAGIPSPKPYTVDKNVLVMEFIGENGVPAPTINKVDVSTEDYHETLSIIQKLYRNANLVHADLSEYNLFKFRNQLILFDFGSAVLISHPRAEEFLKRDIININHFFKRRDIDILLLEESLKLVKEK